MPRKICFVKINSNSRNNRQVIKNQQRFIVEYFRVHHYSRRLSYRIIILSEPFLPLPLRTVPPTARCQQITHVAPHRCLRDRRRANRLQAVRTPGTATCSLYYAVATNLASARTHRRIPQTRKHTRRPPAYRVG